LSVDLAACAAQVSPTIDARPGSSDDARGDWTPGALTDGLDRTSPRFDAALVWDVRDLAPGFDTGCSPTSPPPRLAFSPASCNRLVQFELGAIGIVDVDATTDTLPVRLDVISGAGATITFATAAYSAPGMIAIHGIPLAPGWYQLFLTATDACGRTTRAGPCALTVGARPLLRFERPFDGEVVLDQDGSTPLAQLDSVLRTDAPDGTVVNVGGGSSSLPAIAMGGRAGVRVTVAFGTVELNADATVAGWGTARASVRFVAR